MKKTTNQFWILVKAQAVTGLWASLFMIGIYGIMYRFVFKKIEIDYDLSISGYIPAFIYVMLACMNYEGAFRGMSFGKNTLQASLADCYEFQFTRAISRTPLFWSKSALYFVACLLPVLVLGVSELKHSDVKIKMYSSDKTIEQAKDFYKRSFEGVQTGKVESNEYIVVPHGRFYELFYIAIIALFLGQAYQLVQSLIQYRQKLRMGLYYAILFIPMLYPMLAARGSSELWERDLPIAWVWQHALLCVTGVIVLTVISQWFCWRRFEKLDLGA
jgi:hypothetical protein